MMVHFTEREIELYEQIMSEEDEEKRKMLHAELRKLRKEREAEQLKDCPFAH